MDNNQRSAERHERGERMKNLTIVGVRAVAALMILGIGGFFLMYNTYFDGYEPSMVKIFGYGCLAYGAFRLWRAVNDYIESK